MNASTRKSPTRLALGLLALGCVAAGGFAFWRHLGATERTDNAQIEGTVAPVHARVGGFAQRVAVIDDQPVRRGDTLFTIDPTEFVLKLRQAEAELWAARAASRQGVAGAGARVATAQMQVAASNLEAAQAAVERTGRELARTRILREKDLASQAQLDVAEAAARTAEASLKAARDQSEASGFGQAGAQAQERLADARIASAQAAVEVARNQLSWTVGIAPTSGHVAKRNVEPGQFLSPGQPVMAIVSDSAVWVVANLKETQLARVAPGQAVDVEIDALPGVRLRGLVRSEQYATGARFSLLPPDNASGNFTKIVQRVPVRIDLLDTTHRARLRPGMSANIAIHVAGS